MYFSVVGTVGRTGFEVRHVSFYVAGTQVSLLLLHRSTCMDNMYY